MRFSVESAVQQDEETLLLNKSHVAVLHGTGQRLGTAYLQARSLKNAE